MAQQLHVFAGAKHSIAYVGNTLPKLPLGAHVLDPRTKRWGKIINGRYEREVVDVSNDRVPVCYKTKALILSVL